MTVACSVFVLSSCLKNNKYYVDFSNYEASIELPLAATNLNKPAPVALTTTVPAVEYYVVVNVASVNPLNKEVTATLALDEAYLDEYNQKQDAQRKQEQQDYLAGDDSHTVDDDNYPPDYVPYELFPDSLYTIDTWDLTVKPGERQARATLMISASRMNTDHKYVLPFTITDSNIPISSWNHLMLNIQAKNAYDGDYNNTYSGSLGSGENVVTLSTVSPTTSVTGLIGVYSNEVYITVNPNTNAVTVEVPSLVPTITDPSSKYDPATQTFTLKYTCGSTGQYTISQTMVRK